MSNAVQRKYLMFLQLEMGYPSLNTIIFKYVRWNTAMNKLKNHQVLELFSTPAPVIN